MEFHLTVDTFGLPVVISPVSGCIIEKDKLGHWQ